MRRWDIFCKIVDNFGDIGVCWRLAKQLEHEHGIQVRLWIDDLNIARQLIPALDTNQTTQLIDNISIASWDANTCFDQAAEIIIEAFGCELPEAYLALMQPDTIWVNLEYLSAEPWVEGFHARNSKRGYLTRHFFFPGFTSATGGLLREQGIVEKNRKLAASQQLQAEFFQQLNLAADETSTALKVSLFSYPQAPISDLLAAMANSNKKTVCYTPATSILPKVAEFFGKASISAGNQLIRGNLTVHVLPFLSQADYDKLLASCDINFVRGEDSWIRAIWACKPFIWQPYLQSEDTHITKLKAFLDLFYSGCNEPAQKAVYAMHRHWLSDAIPCAVWQDYLNNLGAIAAFDLQQANMLASLADLASNLVIFIEKSAGNNI
jgi:uncharacterized repeat protein (TIGR03837 family)